MIAGTLYNQLITTLEGNPALSKYVKFVFKGVRENVGNESMPCLILEPVQDGALAEELNTYSKSYFNVDIVGYTYNVSEPDKQIVGDADYKGIVDFAQDVRACLQSSNTLGDRCIDIRLEPTLFDFSEYPVRGFRVAIRILYQQHNFV